MSANIPSVGLLAQVACIWECTARKPGNVHRDHDFEDVTYLDFLHSAAAIQPVLDAASEKTVGEIVLQGIEATRRVVNTNTNLGILLLLAPLAKAGDHKLDAAVGNVLAGLTVADARAVYTAIRLAQPGGMGRVENQDVGAEPTRSLREVMALAAERDLIARQYTNGFQEVFKVGVPALFEGMRLAGTMEGAIVFCQLQLLAAAPDTLIARKRGRYEAEEASRRARRILDAGWPGGDDPCGKLCELDIWLRAEGHQRNPGTTADLVTACLFVLLQEGNMKLPLNIPFDTEELYG